MQSPPSFARPAHYRLVAVVMCVAVIATNAYGQEAPPEVDATDETQDVQLETKFVAGDFPSLPPDPYDDDESELPPLEEELWQHGGSYLYCPEGDRLGWPSDAHYEYLRLPSGYEKPEPLTAFSEFLGADPIVAGKQLKFGGYSLEPRFVASGDYSLFGQAMELADRRQDLVGHNLRVDLDLRLTGTERFHVQFRPLGERNTGGSFYDFVDPDGYVNNSTGEPDRYWFEGELHSLLGFEQDQFAQRYLNFMVGKFPFSLHNSLLMNDEILGGVLSRNNLQLGPLSNLNLQCFIGANDVDTYPEVETQVYGLHATADLNRDFYELTYAYLDADVDRSAHFVGLSRTTFHGPLTLAARGLVKLGDDAGVGGGHLLALESNLHRIFECEPLGFHHGVFFCNAFWAEEGWNSIAGANFNRLRTAFEVDPLVRLTTTGVLEDTVGATLGAQLFRDHDDQSYVPEFAWESRGGDSVFGFGLRHLRKTGRRTFLEVLGIANWSDNSQFDRIGIAISHTYLF